MYQTEYTTSPAKSKPFLTKTVPTAIPAFIKQCNLIHYNNKYNRKIAQISIDKHGQAVLE